MWINVSGNYGVKIRDGPEASKGKTKCKVNAKLSNFRHMMFWEVREKVITRVMDSPCLMRQTGGVVGERCDKVSWHQCTHSPASM